MDNIVTKVSGNTLTIVVDLSKRFGPSASGKTIIVASTRGATKVGDCQHRAERLHQSVMDATERLKRHVECCLKRDAAALRAMELLASGDEDYLSAAQEAELWALRAMALKAPQHKTVRRN